MTRFTAAALRNRKTTSDHAHRHCHCHCHCHRNDHSLHPPPGLARLLWTSTARPACGSEITACRHDDLVAQGQEAPARDEGVHVQRIPAAPEARGRGDGGQRRQAGSRTALTPPPRR
jgi:hypothetical protein